MTTDKDQEESSRSLSGTERTLAKLWSEVLQLPQAPAPADDFFALGGDSMTMTMVEFRIKEEFSIELPVGAVLHAPSLRELSTLVDGSRRLADGSAIQLAP